MCVCARACVCVGGGEGVWVERREGDSTWTSLDEKITLKFVTNTGDASAGVRTAFFLV